VTDAEIESAIAVHRQAIEALEAQSRRICDSERPQMAVACDGVMKGPGLRGAVGGASGTVSDHGRGTRHRLCLGRRPALRCYS
jgi:hypothetical protein